jgi:hypothetical protein
MNLGRNNMYENIRKPGLLKNIPLLLIRALPVLYYYGRYSTNQDFPKGQKLFQQNITYLNRVIAMMKGQLPYKKLIALDNILNDLKEVPNDQISPNVEEFTLALSELCSENTDRCHKFYKENKQQLIDLYRNSVSPLHILTKDILPEEKVCHLLDDFCHYKVTHSSGTHVNYPDQLTINDFVLLSSLSASNIHQEIEQIDAFHKPAIVISTAQQTNPDDKIALRHALQLIRMGIPVIFKILTPIRLFTSIEKTYFKYHTQAFHA